ncbi:ECF transporter S component [Haloimpatiens massiliensis]|uniref:ECF transporter S component n=1 Tax=Haloimpatiens massiliensis TaxID=1658110 RepID=UPI000C82775E|nr:ECF transporter S component [Haloimpatiens massiliensis]
MKTNTKKLTTLAMLSAIAYIIMVLGRIPIVMFLKYDPKDVIITIGGFIFGPLSAFIISVLVSFVEMFTVSDTGFIGFIMNIISTCAFACTAGYIYKRNHTLKGAVYGLITGSILMTIVMLLWNYLIAPIYLGYPREAVAKLLIPAFLPFNLLKGGLNAALTMLLYKPLVNSLRRSNLIPESSKSNPVKKINLGVTLISGLILVTCILLVLVLNGTI